MATAPEQVRAARAKPRREQPRTRLSVVNARALQRHTQRRRARLLALVACGIVAGSLLVVAGTQAVVASQQLRYDGLQQELSNAVATNGNLELQRAQLAAPSRILTLAQHQLGMVTPPVVVYLSPVSAGPSVATSQASTRP